MNPHNYGIYRYRVPKYRVVLLRIESRLATVLRFPYRYLVGGE